ncbi:MAG: type I-U CRISPR-associated protein Cas7 [Bryobacterales bacterium]|nr:type I-U CRISPR-associated protein Cas7 [Bryobacterales bacterium]
MSELNSSVLTPERLKKAVAEDVAIRFSARLQPAGGRGDKVFPPTYAGGQYALESRIDEDGVLKEVVLLDSVQSQANRMEDALLAAHRAERIKLPMISVKFTDIDQLKELGEITVLDAPHRLADAILRDSKLKNADTLFPATAEGQVLRRATPKNATELFKLCPTSLLFGIWESTGAAGGLGVKFQRAIVSEIVGIGAVVGRRTASRIDPLQIGRLPVYEAREPEGGTIRWTADATKAVTVRHRKADGKEEDQPKLYKLDAQGRVNVKAKGVPSEVNHGNVTPDLARHRGQALRLGRDFSEQYIRRDRDGRIVTDRGERFLRDRDELPGGVTFEYAKHTAVLSLAALRKLHFPMDANSDASLEARFVIAALGLFALVELRRDCYDLRSRCALSLDGRPVMEIVKRDGTTEAVLLDEASVKALLDAALEQAKAKKLEWREAPLELEPSTALADLIIQSRRVGTIDTDGEEEAEEEEATQDIASED